jgi:ADP-ribose pyrophosphatase YjhB (NUDIX family)
MRFSVSSDEEYVELTVVVDGEEHALKPRSHHYILLLLARARLDDLDSPESEQGWLYTGELAKMLRASRNQLYVSLYRARKGLAAIGIENASELIERRPTTQQLRLGLSDITVTAL